MKKKEVFWFGILAVVCLGIALTWAGILTDGFREWNRLFALEEEKQVLLFACSACGLISLAGVVASVTEDTRKMRRQARKERREAAEKQKRQDAYREVLARLDRAIDGNL